MRLKMQDHPDNYERVCCMCKQWRDENLLRPCTEKVYEKGEWIKKETVMCVYCQEDEIEDQDEVESEDVLQESYQRTFDQDHRMAEARKLK